MPESFATKMSASQYCELLASSVGTLVRELEQVHAHLGEDPCTVGSAKANDPAHDILHDLEDMLGFCEVLHGLVIQMYDPEEPLDLTGILGAALLQLEGTIRSARNLRPLN